MEYLLAAEADRIQDLLFRSSQLREVVGGSQLLTRFCEETPDLLEKALGITPDVITSGGGGFRITFETKTDARRFGEALAEVYYRATRGTLSVAEPVAIADDSKPTWKEATEKAGERLRQAKQRGPSVATPHIPYVAFCESCGVGLAEAHEARFEEGEGHYLCPSCRIKTAEQDEHRQGDFLRWFYEMVKSELKWPPDPEDVARYDPRNYVAYIIADGDGMGRVFEACSQSQAYALSHKMDEVLREALAEPTRRFMKNAAAARASCIPVLPLILGGDDLFALVPAPWGLDFARRLCRTFQDEMTAFVREKEIRLALDQVDNGELTVTMSAAVVICKVNYPYYLAHQIGEERLSETKRAVKALADEGAHLSAVDFEVVMGSQVAPQERVGDWRSTLRPYWVTEGTAPSGWGLSLSELLGWRRELAGTPARRLSQLRERFDRVPKKGDDGAWDKGLERILERIERDWGREDKHPVRRALEELRGIKLEDWYELDRWNDEDFQYGHGLPDLLQAWDWTLDLHHPPIAYEGGEQ